MESETDNEVNTLDDLIGGQEVDVGTDVPPTEDDGDDFDEEGGEDASMEVAPAEPALPPPAADHSAQRLLAHAEPVFSVAVNAAHPEMLATGGGDDVAHLWRLGTEAPAFRLEGHTDTVGALAFSMDGSLLATGGLDGTVRVWQANAGTLIGAPLEGPTQGINWVAWHPRGAVLLAGSEDATAWMWKLPEGSVMQIFSAHSSSVACAAQFRAHSSRAQFSPRNTRRPINGCPLSSLRYGGFANGGKQVITASEDGTVRLWNPRAGTVDHCFDHGRGAGGEPPPPVSCLCAHAAHPVFLYGAVDGTLRLGHAESGRLLAHLASHEASVEAAGFCQPLPLAASGAMDGKLAIWDLNSFTLRHTCAHGAGVIELRWLRDSPLLVACTVSRELRVWDARSGGCLATLLGHADACLCLELGYTAEGVFALSGSDDRTARVWRVPTEAAAAAAMPVDAAAAEGANLCDED